MCVISCVIGHTFLCWDNVPRSKSAGFFFIASDVLKKLCESKEGHETARALHHHIKMLRNLVQDLEKKVELDKR